MNDQDVCRFCHEEIHLPKEIDHVISPCRCRGSQELVHIECFNKWGKTKCKVCKFRYYAGEIPLENVDGPINLTLLSLVSFVLLLFVDLSRHIMNLYMRDYYYSTGIHMIADGLCMITNKPCSARQY